MYVSLLRIMWKAKFQFNQWTCNSDFFIFEDCKPLNRENLFYNILICKSKSAYITLEGEQWNVTSSLSSLLGAALPWLSSLSLSLSAYLYVLWLFPPFNHNCSRVELKFWYVETLSTYSVFKTSSIQICNQIFTAFVFFNHKLTLVK